MSISYCVQTDCTFARRRSNLASLKVWSNALVVDTRSIAFKMSSDFCCKAWQSKSVILIILCIKYKMNINSKDFITIKQPLASPCIELNDPSWELHRVVPLRYKLPIWLAPLPVSRSPAATIYAIFIAWVWCNSVWLLGETLIRLIMIVNFEKNN